jgi:hypothetical protein
MSFGPLLYSDRYVVPIRLGSFRNEPGIVPTMALPHTPTICIFEAMIATLADLAKLGDEASFGALCRLRLANRALHVLVNQYFAHIVDQLKRDGSYPFEWYCAFQLRQRLPYPPPFLVMDPFERLDRWRRCQNTRRACQTLKSHPCSVPLLQRTPTA